MEQSPMAGSKVRGAFLGSDLVDFYSITLVDSVGSMQSSLKEETCLFIQEELVKMGIDCLNEPMLVFISKESDKDPSEVLSYRERMHKCKYP